ncbi:MAG: hypothetical protein FWF85_05400 [Clostridiales bacterium]|nr:hypothetical protein [Clostridiales bacterium]
MNYKADLYIMLPCSSSSDIKLGIPYDDPSCPKDARLFMEELSDRAGFEFDIELHKILKRYFLKEIVLRIEDDSGNDNLLDEKQKGFIVIAKSKRKHTSFCLLFVVIPNIDDKYITDLFDQVSRNEIKIIVDGEEPCLLKKYIKEKYELEITGKAFTASCMTEPQREKEKEYRYLLSGETRNNPNSTIKSKHVDSLINENHAQYEEYALFLSDYCALCIMKEFNENDYKSRLKIECLLLFIMELVILKITAINSANNAIVNEFKDSENDNCSLVKIKEIAEKFVKSLPLWDTRNFKYFNAQTEANKIEDSFRVPDYFNNYEKNLEHFENIAKIRDTLATEKEAKSFGRLTIIVSILALFQIVPLFFGLPRERIIPYGITLLVAIMIVIICFYPKETIKKIGHLIKKIGCSIMRKTKRSR